MAFYLLLLLVLLIATTFAAADHCSAPPPTVNKAVFPGDINPIQFALNLEYLEAEFFLFGALGHGLDVVAPDLPEGGPPPVGARWANLDNVTRGIIAEFGNQEVGHLRAIKKTVGSFPRPKYDLSAQNFANIINNAFGSKLNPPFDPYASSVNYLIASYAIPYVGLVGYVGASPNINGYATKRLLTGLLAVESGQDAVIRAILYEMGDAIVQPYNSTVAEFTDRISELRNNLAGCGDKDQGLNTSTGWVLSGDTDSVAFGRTAAEILRIVYGTGDESKPGGFLPNGGDGAIAKSYL